MNGNGRYGQTPGGYLVFDPSFPGGQQVLKVGGLIDGGTIKRIDCDGGDSICVYTNNDYRIYRHFPYMESLNTVSTP